MLETNDLKHLVFPDVLLKPGPVEIELGVTHYRAPGGAWGQFALLFVIFADAPSRTAQVSRVSPVQ